MLTVVFRVGEQRYGLPANQVQEIVLRPALVEPAGAPLLLSGLVNIAGHYLPVLDGRVLIGGEPIGTIHSHVLLLGQHKLTLALLVEEVIDVIEFRADQVTQLAVDIAAPFLASIVNDPAGAVLMVDLDALQQLAPGHATEFVHD